jgi:hypothetical protein
MEFSEMDIISYPFNDAIMEEYFLLCFNGGKS